MIPLNTRLIMSKIMISLSVKNNDLILLKKFKYFISVILGLHKKKDFFYSTYMKTMTRIVY